MLEQLPILFVRHSLFVHRLDSKPKQLYSQIT